MQATFDRGTVCLAPRGLFQIADASGVEVACTRGTLWLTLDNDLRDVVLEPGESFFTTEHRRAIVYAFDAATLRLTGRAATAAQPSVRRSEAKNGCGWRLRHCLAAYVRIPASG